MQDMKEVNEMRTTWEESKQELMDLQKREQRLRETIGKTNPQMARAIFTDDFM